MSSYFSLKRCQRKLVFTFRTSNSVTLYQRGTTRAGKSPTISNVKRKTAFRTPNDPLCLRQCCHFHIYAKGKLHAIKCFLKSAEETARSKKRFIKKWKILTMFRRILLTTLKSLSYSSNNSWEINV